MKQDNLIVTVLLLSCGHFQFPLNADIIPSVVLGTVVPTGKLRLEGHLSSGVQVQHEQDPISKTK